MGRAARHLWTACAEDIVVLSPPVLASAVDLAGARLEGLRMWTVFAAFYVAGAIPFAFAEIRDPLIAGWRWVSVGIIALWPIVAVAATVSFTAAMIRKV